MNKQETIEKLKQKARYHCGEIECYKDGCTKNVELDTAIDIVSEMDEHKKVIVPPYIANWLKYCSSTGVWLRNAILFDDVSTYNYANTVKYRHKIVNWLNIKNNQEKFADAWLNGYVVEKEKFYTVEIPGIVKNNSFLNYIPSTDKWEFNSCGENHLYQTQFIKKDLEDAGFGWVFNQGFAKEVLDGKTD